MSHSVLLFLCPCCFEGTDERRSVPCVARSEGLDSLLATAVMKEIASLANIRRAPGASGRLGNVKGTIGGPFKTATTFIISKEQRCSFFPQSMEIVYSVRR